MNTGDKSTVRAKQDPRGPTWAVDKARQAHAILAAQLDRASGRERDRILAEMEHLARIITSYCGNTSRAAANRVRKLEKALKRYAA